MPVDRIDDVVQDVLLTIHRARRPTTPKRSFDAWLRVIAERRAIDLLRRARRRGAREVHAPLAFESHADQAPIRPAGSIRRTRAGTVTRALAKLPDRQREAVHHLVIEERSLADAAALTGAARDRSR